MNNAISFENPKERRLCVFDASFLVEVLFSAYTAGKNNDPKSLSAVAVAVGDKLKVDENSQIDAIIDIAKALGDRVYAATLAEHPMVPDADPSAIAALPQGASISVYTDGACIGNPGPAGCAFVVVADGKAIYASSRHLGNGTNNIAEISAAIGALEALVGRPDLKPTVCSDAKYVVDGISSWIVGWKRKGWKNAAGEPVANRPLWERLDALASTFPALSWRWVKGHNGDRFNEMVDALANKAAATPSPDID
ncbi:ribonuclease HI [Neorhizobium galegae]|uniref:ribonuclease H family protein n=1 Tax=Neorhizobium galegae TaxID=399 RepID=UPI0021015F9B|nr:ribonuclease H [Neorhizobium galegae]MCQ1571741.1 ribonuclease HI [Neorhizobium galegae]